jgi:formylglycine-generating enzyme required for sulfatase activity
MKSLRAILPLLLVLLVLGPTGPLAAGEDPPAPPPPGEAEDPPEPPPSEGEDPPAPPPTPGEDPAPSPPSPGGGDATAPGDGEPPAPEAPAEPPPAPAAAADFPFDVPPGMVGIPGASVEVGSPFGRVNTLTDGRDDVTKNVVIFEAPRHRVSIPTFCLDRTECSNAQYYRFMQDQEVTLVTLQGQLLQEIAGASVGLPASEWEQDEFLWRQLYQTNEEVLHARMPDVLVRDSLGNVDEGKTERAFRRAPLPRDIELRWTRRRPPRHWPTLAPSEDQQNLPVVWVTYNDAAAFAEWAGKHVMTEYEYEYAAAGPEGRYYPWGNVWHEDGSHCNWKGFYKDARGIYPVLLPVDSLPDGASSFGVLNLLGNAAEWTSSWFERYPGNAVGNDRGWTRRYVKVVRGGSYTDEEPLVLRNQARNWVGRGREAPPLPGNRFETIGFRCAWYPEPGRDQIGPVLARAERGRRVAEAALRLDLYGGAVSARYAPSEAEAEHHAFVLGAARAILLIPVRSIFAPDEREARIRKPIDLLKASEGREDPIVLGVLHTDVPLEKVWVRGEITERWRKEAEKARSRNETIPPPVQEGSVPADTYVLALWHRRLALVTPSLEFVCFLTREGRNPALEAVQAAPSDVPFAVVEATPEAGIVELVFVAPAGGHRTDKNLAVRVSAILNVSEQHLAGTWRIREPTPPAPPK